MKTKIILFIALVAIFSSFTFISNVNNSTKAESTEEAVNQEGTAGGFTMQDRGNW
jgi:hypothetical protein